MAPADNDCVWEITSRWEEILEWCKSLCFLEIPPISALSTVLKYILPNSQNGDHRRNASTNLPCLRLSFWYSGPASCVGSKHAVATIPSSFDRRGDRYHNGYTIWNLHRDREKSAQRHL